MVLAVWFLVVGELEVFSTEEPDYIEVETVAVVVRQEGNTFKEVAIDIVVVVSEELVVCRLTAIAVTQTLAKHKEVALNKEAIKFHELPVSQLLRLSRIRMDYIRDFEVYQCFFYQFLLEHYTHS